MKLETRSYFKLLSKYLKPLRIQVIFLGIVSAASIALQLIMPQILGSFIDSARDGVPVKALIIKAGYFIGSAIVQQILAITSTYIAQVVGWNSTNKLRVDLIDKCLKLDMNFHKNHMQGEMIERIDGDVTALFNFFSKLLPNLLNNMVLMIGILIMLFKEGILVGIPITIFVILALYIFIHIQKKAVPVWGENRIVTSEFYGLLGEVETAKKNIKII